MSRFEIRVAEIDASIALLTELLPNAQMGEHRTPLDPVGRLTRVKIVDRSFFNWPALPVALAGDTIVPDFSIANKSFNQSYAGNDL